MHTHRSPVPTISIAAISLVLALAGRAHAQDADATALFDQGNELLKDGQIVKACEAFEASNRAEARAGTLIKLGECREQNHQLASAWSAYKDALIRVKDPHKKDVAEEKIAAVEPRLSYMTLIIPDASHVNGLVIERDGKPVDLSLWNRTLPIDGGDYVIAAHAPGHDPWQTTATVPQEGRKVTIEVPRLRESAAPPEPPPEAEPESILTGRRKLALGAAGVSLVGIAVGTVLGVSARSKRTDAYALCPDPATPCEQADAANALIHSGRTRALEANISFAVAGAAVIATAVLWLTGAPEPATEVSIVPSPRGISLVGRF